jgi:Flp pilus assembly pilin Flp
MKNITNKIKSTFTRFVKDESGQGSAEYILLIALVVAVIMMFGPRIKTAIEGKTGQLESQIQGANF